MIKHHEINEELKKEMVRTMRDDVPKEMSVGMRELLLSHTMEEVCEKEEIKVPRGNRPAADPPLLSLLYICLLRIVMVSKRETRSRLRDRRGYNHKGEVTQARRLPDHVEGEKSPPLASPPHIKLK